MICTVVLLPCERSETGEVAAKPTEGASGPNSTSPDLPLDNTAKAPEDDTHASHHRRPTNVKRLACLGAYPFPEVT